MQSSQQRQQAQLQGFYGVPAQQQQQQQQPPYYGQRAPNDPYVGHHHQYYAQPPQYNQQQQHHYQHGQQQPPYPVVVGAAVPPPSYASVGYPQQAPPQPQTGAVFVEYESRCCCTQPRRGSVTVKCDDVKGCSVSQGGMSSFVAPAGMHRFSVSTDNVVEKFFRGLFKGDEDRGPQTIAVVRPNGRLVLRVRWDSNGCCSSKYHLAISAVQ